jgi:hypothetical protein
MSDTKFTPGPWEWCFMDRPLSEIGEYVQSCVTNSPGKQFHFICGAHPDGGEADVCHVGNGPTSEANARLIAAAPEMFEALKNLLMIVEVGIDTGTFELAGSLAAYPADARAALAKAVKS